MFKKFFILCSLLFMTYGLFAAGNPDKWNEKGKFIRAGDGRVIGYRTKDNKMKTLMYYGQYAKYKNVEAAQDQPPFEFEGKVWEYSPSMKAWKAKFSNQELAGDLLKLIPIAIGTYILFDENGKVVAMIKDKTIKTANTPKAPNQPKPTKVLGGPSEPVKDLLVNPEQIGISQPSAPYEEE